MKVRPHIAICGASVCRPGEVFSHFLVSPKIRLFSSHFPSHFWTRTYPKAPETVHFNVCKVLIGKESDQLKPISKPPPSASRPPLRRCGISFYHWGLPVWCTLPLSLHPRANTLPVIMKRQSLRYAERFLAPGHPLSHGEPSSRVLPVIIEPETDPGRPDCLFAHRHSHDAAWPYAADPDRALGDE